MKDNLAITNFDLDEMLKHNKSYGGTVPHNLVKTIPSNRNSSQVINLHHSHQPGSHFVCLFNDIKSPYVYYFDSYGLYPSDLVQEAIRKTGKKIMYNSKTIQSVNSNRCGFYCYLFIEMMSNKIPFLEFIDYFSNSNKINNDKILLGFLN